MNRLLLILLFFTLNWSCKKEQLCDCVPAPKQVFIDIHYLNKAGQSLINSREEFADSLIKIFYKKNGFFQNAYDHNMDDPEKFDVHKTKTEEIRLVVTPSYYYMDSNFSETMVELNPKVRDIIRCEFAFSHGGRNCTNVWFNGVKMDSTFFEVIK